MEALIMGAGMSLVMTEIGSKLKGLRTAGGILFAAGLGAGSNKILKKTSLV